MRIALMITLYLLMQAMLSGCGVKVQGIELGRVVSAITKVGELDDKDQAEEIQMGQETSQALLSQKTLTEDDLLQRYINKVGYWLVRHTSRPNLPWRFIVINDTSVNAFAAPGGYVFITTGMIGSLTNEAELAGVLAHEIAHVLKRHHLEAIQDTAQRGLLSDLAVLSAQTHQARQSEGNKSIDHPDIASVFEKNIRKLYEKGLERDDEIEADLIGIHLAAKAGYDPYAFVSVLQAIQSQEQNRQDDLLHFIQTHPAAETRLEALEPTLAKLEHYELEMRILSQRFISNTRY